jgi:hypothetical protein
MNGIKIDMKFSPVSCSRNYLPIAIAPRIALGVLRTALRRRLNFLFRLRFLFGISRSGMMRGVDKVLPDW